MGNAIGCCSEEISPDRTTNIPIDRRLKQPCTKAIYQTSENDSKVRNKPQDATSGSTTTNASLFARMFKSENRKSKDEVMQRWNFDNISSDADSG